jgi:hypothetical protein
MAKLASARATEERPLATSQLRWRIVEGRTMGDFSVTLKVEKFELNVTGSREDLPLIADRVGQQFIGLLQPAADIVSGDITETVQPTQAVPSVDGKRKALRRKRTSATAAVTAGSTTEAGDGSIAWRHDADKWGTPKQEWSVSNKIVYVMHVAKVAANKSDITSPSIVATFNKLFKSAGQLSSKNIVRDLNKLKQNDPALVSDDNTQSPTVWFLTQQGEREGVRLISEARGLGSSTQTAQADVFSNAVPA